MAALTPITEPLTAEQTSEIVQLFTDGRRVSEVIAHGLTRRPSWRRHHVVDLIADRGWTLDSDGRIPKRLRTSLDTPTSQLPGAPDPRHNPPREPAVEYPERGTITEGPRATTGAAVNSMINRWVDGARTHEAAAVRRAANKAHQALDELHQLLVAETQNDAIRKRLAVLEAEAAKLRAQLAGKQPKKHAMTTPATDRKAHGKAKHPATFAKPIKHGSWGGFLAETARGLEHCADCIAAKDEHLARMRGLSPSGQKSAAKTAAGG